MEEQNEENEEKEEEQLEIFNFNAKNFILSK